jgi:hypothetical protein
MLVCSAVTRTPVCNRVTVGGIEFDTGNTRVGNLRIFIRHAAQSGGAIRLLVFSDNCYVLEAGGVRAAFDEGGIPARMLKGNAATVASVMRGFKNSERSALLINCQHYGSGMDLSEATDIIFLHHISPALQAQVLGRAQRPPRTTPLRVWMWTDSRSGAPLSESGPDARQ